MVTLSKRSTEAQNQLFRIVEGAIENAIHAHPDWAIDPRFVHSISKRAVGTATAVWPELLAALPEQGKPSDIAGEQLHTPTSKRVAQFAGAPQVPAQKSATLRGRRS